MNEPTLGCLEEPPSAGTAVWVREQESETFARAVATGTTSGARAVVTCSANFVPGASCASCQSAADASAPHSAAPGR